MSEAVAAALSFPSVMNGIHDPLRFACATVSPVTLSLYDGLLVGLTNMMTNAISQLSGSPECMASIAGVPVTFVGGLVSKIVNFIFNSYMYYNYIVKPGSAILEADGMDCSAYKAAQEASYGVAAGIFIFESFPQKIAAFLAALVAEDPTGEGPYNPLGIGGGGY